MPPHRAWDDAGMAEKYAAIFKDHICDVGQYLADADAAGKKVPFEAQLAPARHDFGIYPYTTPPTIIGAMPPSAQASWPQADQLHRRHEGLFLLRRRRPPLSLSWP